MQNVEWKPQAYRKAARALENSKDVRIIYKKGGLKALEEIPGIGEGLGKKIIQYIETGKINQYEKVKKLVPKRISKIIEIPGMGPKKADLLYKKLGIKTIKDLELAISQHKIAKLKTFGSKSEENLKNGIALLKKGFGERVPLKVAIVSANKIVSNLKKYTNKITVAGSIRRKKSTVRDIDILATSKNPNKAMDTFTKMREVVRVLGHGTTKSTIVLKNGIQSDLRIVPEKSYGAALSYFTGSKEHNVKLRQIAIRKGCKLSEYGLFDRKTNKFITGKTEKDIYKALDLDYVPPEKRTS